MRRFESCFLVLAMSLNIFITACGNGNRSQQIEERTFDRVAAVARMEARLSEDKAWKERYRPLAAREKQGEDVGAEIASLKAERRALTDLKDDAVRIVDTNPTDEAAFQAIGIVMKTNHIDDMNNWEGSASQALQERMLRVLLEHHLQRSDFLDVVYAYFSNSEDSVAFWRKVFDASPWPTVRASAAYELTKNYSQWLDELDLAPEKREEVRRQVQYYGRILRDDYADVSPLSEKAANFLAALNYSPGATLPSIDVATLAGGFDTLTNYRGKIVLLDFWATWCGACRKDHPKLVALKHEMAGKPFEIISVSADETRELVTEYLAKELSLSWPQWYVGPEGNLLTMWGVSGYPTYLLVDSDGVIRARGLTTSLSDINDHARKLVAQVEAKQSQS